MLVLLERREVFYRTILILVTMQNIPRLLMGDFNDILNSCDYFGGYLPNPSRISEFKSCLDERKLFDLGFEGPKFT